MVKKNTPPTKYKEMAKEVSEYFAITLGGILGLLLSLCIVAHLFSS